MASRDPIWAEVCEPDLVSVVDVCTEAEVIFLATS